MINQIRRPPRQNAQTREKAPLHRDSRAHLSNRIESSQAAHSILRSREISSMKKANRKNVPKLRKQLLAHAEAHIPRFKEMRGKSLERILWQTCSERALNTFFQQCSFVSFYVVRVNLFCWLKFLGKPIVAIIFL